MEQIINRHKVFWSKKLHSQSAIASILLLFLSLFINYYANIYTNMRASNYVSDIILDNIPVLDVDFIFVEGFLLFLLFVVILLAHEPRKLPFVLKSIAIFVLIRSIFISLTHLAEPPNHIAVDTSNWFLSVTSGNDLFFSSHTGLPFLMALNFWQNKILRTIFLICTFIFASTVLLGHLHYSIDVFAAFFITYGIFHIAREFFAEDYAIHMAAVQNKNNVKLNIENQARVIGN